MTSTLIPYVFSGILLPERFYVYVLGILIYLVFICLLARLVGFNILDLDEESGTRCRLQG